MTVRQAKLSANAGAGNRYRQTLARIESACQSCGRQAAQLQLLAVSKTRAAPEIESLYALGHRDFGENYLQESLPKIAALPRDCRWHFIGPLQGNKTRAVAENFDWVHSLCSARHARRLAAARPADRDALRVFVQVNIDAEPSKAGCDVADVAALCAEIQELPALELRGLMAIPRPERDGGDPAAAFSRLAQLQDSIAPALPDLSMGMSDDLEAAVAAGSTILRIGTALFGPRPQ